MAQSSTSSVFSMSSTTVANTFCKSMVIDVDCAASSRVSSSRVRVVISSSWLAFWMAIAVWLAMIKPISSASAPRVSVFVRVSNSKAPIMRPVAIIGSSK